MMLETHMKLCMAEPDFLENFFCPKNWENGPKMEHIEYIPLDFLNILRNFAINFY